MSDSERPAGLSRHYERRARLKKRLAGGIFTALLAVNWALPTGSAEAAAAAVAPKASLESRVEDLRASPLVPPDSAAVKPDQIAPLWGNLWFNWGNHKWNKWNKWAKWNNWNNWQKWDNWSNWGNAPWSNWANAPWANWANY
jgi:hypothetical protein